MERQRFGTSRSARSNPLGRKDACHVHLDAHCNPVDTASLLFLSRSAGSSWSFCIRSFHFTTRSYDVSTYSFLGCHEHLTRRAQWSLENTKFKAEVLQLRVLFCSMSSHSHMKQSQGWQSLQYHFRRTSDLALYLSTSGRSPTMFKEMSPSNSTSQSSNSQIL